MLEYNRPRYCTYEFYALNALYTPYALNLLCDVTLAAKHPAPEQAATLLKMMLGYSPLYPVAVALCVYPVQNTRSSN